METMHDTMETMHITFKDLHKLPENEQRYIRDKAIEYTNGGYYILVKQYIKRKIRAQDRRYCETIRAQEERFKGL
jgi:hypothetical protein